MALYDKAKKFIFSSSDKDEQKDIINTEEEQEILNRVMTDFSVFKADREKQEHLWEEEEDFYRGDHWKKLRSGEASKLRPNAESNMVFAYAESVCGKLAGWMPFPDYQPIEENDEKTSQALNDYIPYELRKIGFKETHRRAVLRMVKHGPLIYKVFYDPTIEGGRGMNRYEGRNDIVSVDFSTFYPDPRIKDFKRMYQMGAVIQRTRQPLEYFCERWKKKGETVNPDNEGEEVFNESIGDWGAGENSRRETCGLLEYWYRGVPRMMSKEDKELFREMGDDALERGVDPDEYYAKAKGNMEGIHCIYVSTSGVFLEHKSYVYDHGQYPFIARTLYPLEGNVWGKGFIRDIIKPQIFLNRYSEIIMDTLGKQGGSAIMYEEGAITRPRTWAEQRGLPGAMLPVATGYMGKVQELQGVNVPNSIFNIIDHQMLLIQKITGQFDSANGQATAAVTSGEQAKALMAAAGTRLNIASDVITDALEEVFMMLVELIAQFYTTERIARVNGRKVTIGRDTIINRIDDVEYTPDRIGGDEMAAPEMFRNSVEEGMNPEELTTSGDPNLSAIMDTGMTGQSLGNNPIEQQEPIVVQEEFVPEFDIRVNVGVDKPQDREYWIQFAFNLLNLRDPVTGGPIIDAESVRKVIDTGHMEPMSVIELRLEEAMQQQQQVEQITQQAQQLAQENEQLQQQLEQMGQAVQSQDSQQKEFDQNIRAAEVDQKQQKIDLENVREQANIMAKFSNNNQPGFA